MIPRIMHPLFSMDQYLIQEKFWKFFGGKFWFKDMEGNIVAYCKQKAFRLKEDIVLFSDESCTTALLNIKARNVIDFAATYDIIDVESGQILGSAKRKGWKSLVKDTWKLLDASGNQYGEMIEDSNANKDTKPTYVYGQKSIEDNPLKNQYLIDKVSYPTSFNALKSLRMGAWSGYIMGLDPTSLGESRLPTKSTKVAAKTSWYGYEKMFKGMSKLEKGGNIPIDIKSSSIKSLINRPKRIKYKVLPTHLYDLPSGTSGKGSTRKFKQWENTNTLKSQGKNLDHHMETAAYNFLRKKAIEAIQLQIEVPGNLGLYAGEGIKVEIPRMLAKGSKVELDKMYSGNYLIGGVVHTYKTTNTQTTLHLLKDSIKV